MKNASIKQSLAAVGASLTAILAMGGVAFAHVDPDPIAMQAGTTGTVAFNVEHGCDGSPMTDLKIQIPTGVTDVKPVEKAGWTATVAGDTVEFTGGSLDAATADHFDITLTAPAATGDIHFPAIEKCAVGEIDWIQIAAEGEEEPELPAPTLKITQDPPTAEELTPAPEEGEATSDTAVTSDTAAVTATVASSDDSSNTGTIVVAVAVVAVILVGGGVVLTRRKRNATDS